MMTDWKRIEATALARFEEGLRRCQQSPVYHAEGDAYVHTMMVCDALKQLPEYQALNERQRHILYIAALLHDIGKIPTTVFVDGDWHTPHHAPTGSRMVRELLWKDYGLCGQKELMEVREAICLLVRYHSYPPVAIEREYDDIWGKVILMSGLPGTGKDTWIKHNLPDLPVISLDDIRRANKISPTAEQGKVANLAREQAKEHLRRHQSFVWNATNITTQMRESLISLFETYHARVRIVYLETDWNTLLGRNRSREDIVPQAVIKQMQGKMVLPEAYEASKVEWFPV